MWLYQKYLGWRADRAYWRYMDYTVFASSVDWDFREAQRLHERLEYWAERYARSIGR